MEEPKKTSLGINENVEALLCYLVGWVTGIIFLILEKENKFVRFHAMQSLVTFAGLWVVSIVLWFVPLLGLLAAFVIGPLSLILWIILMVKAYQGEKFKLPVAGDIAEKQMAG